MAGFGMQLNAKIAQHQKLSPQMQFLQVSPVFLSTKIVNMFGAVTTSYLFVVVFMPNSANIEIKINTNSETIKTLSFINSLLLYFARRG